MHFAVLAPACNKDELAMRLAPYRQGAGRFMEFIDCTAEVEAKAKEICPDQGKTYLEVYGTLPNLARDFFHFRIKQGRFGYRKNPNGRWDYYLVGGAWSGLLKIKAEKSARQESILFNPASHESDRADSTLNRHVDWEATRDEQAEPFMVRYDKIQEMRQELEQGKITQEEMESNALGLFLFNDLPKLIQEKSLTFTREEFQEYARNRSLTTAFIDLQGTWHESSGQPEHDFDGEYWGFINGLPQNQRIWVVCCHS